MAFLALFLGQIYTVYPVTFNLDYDRPFTVYLENNTTKAHDYNFCNFMYAFNTQSNISGANCLGTIHPKEQLSFAINIPEQAILGPDGNTFYIDAVDSSQTVYSYGNSNDSNNANLTLKKLEDFAPVIDNVPLVMVVDSTNHEALNIEAISIPSSNNAGYSVVEDNSYNDILHSNQYPYYVHLDGGRDKVAKTSQIFFNLSPKA
jgi:hypothetical protein